MHIGAQWDELARRHGDRPAIIDDGGTWSYRQTHSRITKFGNALIGLGLRKGERVALLIPDIREYLEADYATMSPGQGNGSRAYPRYAGGGGRNETSCLAASATTSSGFCSFMLWIAQNRS